MKTYISQLLTHDSDENFEHICVEVTFYDDVTIPHPGATVTVFLKKNSKKTLNDIKDEAVQKAKEYIRTILD